MTEDDDVNTGHRHFPHLGRLLRRTLPLAAGQDGWRLDPSRLEEDATTSVPLSFTGCHGAPWWTTMPCAEHSHSVVSELCEVKHRVLRNPIVCAVRREYGAQSIWSSISERTSLASASWGATVCALLCRPQRLVRWQCLHVCEL